MFCVYIFLKFVVEYYGVFLFVGDVKFVWVVGNYFWIKFFIFL